jgi:hypothetical protein
LRLRIATSCRATSISIAFWRTARTGCAASPRSANSSAIRAGSIRGCARWRSCKSAISRSPYEYSHHIKIGRDFGVSDDDVRAIIAETEGRPTALEPLAKAALRAAREMTTDMAVSDATFAELRQGLDTECLTDLVMTIAFYNGVVRLLATMQIDVENDYLRYLDEFPLPRD